MVRKAEGRREDCCTAAGAAKLAAQFEILKWFFAEQGAGGRGRYRSVYFALIYEVAKRFTCPRITYGKFGI